MGLTLGRLLAPLVICPLILAHWPLLATLVFALAAATDWLDGFLARRWDMTSELGQALDPIADKILVVLTLFALAAKGGLGGLTLALIFLLLFREIAVTALRQSAHIPVKTLSKLKTVFQALAIGGLILGGGFTGWAQLLLLISLILGLYTAWLYAREALV